MFLIRNAILDDHESLIRLARTVHSNNLPADSNSLHDILTHSRASFKGEVEPRDRQYIFVLVDTESNRVVGTSCLIAGKGSEKMPRLVLKVRKREHYSRDLQSGHVQITLQLCQDSTGSTEVGGLVLASSHRGTTDRLGSLLSKVRFSFMGMSPELFSERIIGEIMGALTPDGRTMLWDHLGRRFINLSYREADAFSRTSKEFITSLFPEVEIYASLLPAEARRLIGHVSPDAVPALRMLERLGFHHIDEVDPFDGGPYLEAVRDEIPLVRSTETSSFKSVVSDSSEMKTAIVCTHRGGDFRAVRSGFRHDDDGVCLPEAAVKALGLEPGMSVSWTPQESSGGDSGHRSAGQESLTT